VADRAASQAAGKRNQAKAEVKFGDRKYAEIRKASIPKLP
jgi:hypothetical protein